MTPNTSTWEEHRALHLLAHVESRAEGERLPDWPAEVHAARSVRDEWPGRDPIFPPQPLTGERFEQATEAAELLEARGLDGRDLGPKGRVFRRAKFNRLPSAVLSLVFFLLLLPFSITSLGFQIALGRLLGDSTDEGLDARTSYQFLAAFFGSLLIWPVVALGWTLLVWFNQGVVGDLLGWADGWLTLGTTTSFSGLLAVYLFCFPLFWASGKSFAAAWDVWADTRKAWVRWRFPRQEKSRLETLISELTP